MGPERRSTAQNSRPVPQQFDRFADAGVDDGGETGFSQDDIGSTTSGVASGKISAAKRGYDKLLDRYCSPLQNDTFSKKRGSFFLFMRD